MFWGYEHVCEVDKDTTMLFKVGRRKTCGNRMWLGYLEHVYIHACEVGESGWKDVCGEQHVGTCG